jgi:hypothetical protein
MAPSDRPGEPPGELPWSAPWPKSWPAPGGAPGELPWFASGFKPWPAPGDEPGEQPPEPPDGASGEPPEPGPDRRRHQLERSDTGRAWATIVAAPSVAGYLTTHHATNTTDTPFLLPQMLAAEQGQFRPARSVASLIATHCRRTAQRPRALDAHLRTLRLALGAAPASISLMEREFAAAPLYREARTSAPGSGTGAPELRTSGVPQWPFWGQAP